ncbi:MAG: motif putative anchor domain protein [Herminiimonas sp.]|nr:motif putative anchor domain protein [Herminiimonas sp.]
MNKNLAQFFFTVGVLAVSSHVGAAEITVLPSDIGVVKAQNQWYIDNFRDISTGYTSKTTAAVTETKPRSGNGSVEMSLTDSSGKADFAYNWGFVNGRTLGNLTALSYDWYRDGASTAAAHLQPAYRLVYDTDGNAATTTDQGYLIWEQVYNGTTLSNQWVSSNILDGNFWQRQFSPGFTVENFGTTLAEWTNGPRPGNADQLSANTAILGIEFGIGSGWNGTFTGFVDNVAFGFQDEDLTRFNFEVRAGADVPEPASVALVGLGLLGLAAARKRKQS